MANSNRRSAPTSGTAAPGSSSAVASAVPWRGRPDSATAGHKDLGDYYAWLGEETAQAIVGSAAKDADMVKQYVSAFETAGCDELILFPASSNPDQVSLLAEAAGL